MERELSVEEKIRRAEEISARRRCKNEPERYIRNDYKNPDSKHKYKKIIIQMLVCILLYIVIFMQNNFENIFPAEINNKIKETLYKDMDLSSIGSFINEKINLLKQKENVNLDENIDANQENIVDEQKEEDAQGNSEENVEQDMQDTKLEEAILSISSENEAILEETESSFNQMEIDENIIKEKVQFIKPVKGVISSQFGVRNPTTATVPKFHTGLDIAQSVGTKIVAAMSGTVIEVSSYGDYGNHIKIENDDIMTLYAHCSKIYVNEGQEVSQGEEIGEVGATGNVTGPHLHFEIRRENRYINPQDVMDF